MTANHDATTITLHGAPQSRVIVGKSLMPGAFRQDGSTGLPKTVFTVSHKSHGLFRQFATLAKAVEFARKRAEVCGAALVVNAD